jgi:hypothetical protein
MNLELTPVQSRVFRDPARFKVCICGRRGGKTYLGLVWLMLGAAQHPKSVNWFIAPTQQNAKDLFYHDMLEMLPPKLVGRKNGTDLEIELVNGSRLRGLSAEQAKRGSGVNRVVCDEFAWWERNFDDIWLGEIRPALSDREGAALFTTTPAGYNHAYDLYMFGSDETQTDWTSFQWTTLQGGHVSDAEVDAARRAYDSIDPRLFRQEYEASFETLQGRVYSNFDRIYNVRAVKDTGAELLIGMDFNVHPMSAVVAVRAADECHVIAEVELLTSNTDEMADVLNVKYEDRAIVVCPDPTGRARKTSAGGKTDFSILESAGFHVRAPARPPLVRDRINNTQSMLLAGDRRRLFVHPRCKKLIKALDGLTYRPDTNAPDKASGLDHITDALGYLLWQEFNLLENRSLETFTFRV